MLSTSASRRPLAVALATCFALLFAPGVALITSVIGAGPASAHATLVRITPGAGDELPTAPTQVVIEFNEPVSTSFATVVVTTAVGVSVSRGKPTVWGGKVTQSLSPAISSGGYRIAYRVVSDDGHPVTGESAFAVRLAPIASPVTSAAAPSSASPVAASLPDSAAAPADVATQARDGWLSWSLVLVAGAAGLLALAGAAALWRKRRRH